MRPRRPANWRPISLLNIDYMICTKVLANRSRRVLPRIINKDQTCGIPDRGIYENLFLLRDTIDYVKHKQLSVAIITLDQEKAFDRVNHGFLQRVLSRFNFGPHFHRWIDVVYTDIISNVINNGWHSSPFRLERVVRQGCPLSPLFYCLVVETLGQVIRQYDWGNSNPRLQSTAKQSVTLRWRHHAILANDYSITQCFHIVTTLKRDPVRALTDKKPRACGLVDQPVGQPAL